jgi:hypothetical protein
MAQEKKSIRIYLPAETYEQIEVLAKENDISLSAAAVHAVNFYLDHKDEDLDSEALINRVEKLLHDALSNQKELIDKELQYMRTISNQSHKDSFTYIHLLNSFLWKLNMSESDYCNAAENINPVLKLAAADGKKIAAKYRESRITNDEKYGKQ